MTLYVARQQNNMSADPVAVPEAREVNLDELPASIRHVVDMAMRAGIPYSLRRLPAEAVDPETIAAACGTEVEALVRCMLFRGKTTKKPMLVLASAKTAVSERALSQLVGEVQMKADAATTQRVTGFAPEGLPPFGLSTRLPIVMDETLGALGRIWCMAGSADLIMSVPNSIMTRAISARLARLD